MPAVAISVYFIKCLIFLSWLKSFSLIRCNCFWQMLFFIVQKIKDHIVQKLIQETILICTLLNNREFVIKKYKDSLF